MVHRERIQCGKRYIGKALYCCSKTAAVGVRSVPIYSFTFYFWNYYQLGMRLTTNIAFGKNPWCNGRVQVLLFFSGLPCQRTSSFVLWHRHPNSRNYSQISCCCYLMIHVLHHLWVGWISEPYFMAALQVSFLLWLLNHLIIVEEYW